MKEKLKQKIKMWAVCGVLILAACVGVSKVVTVTNTVNGKELPIYSVETDEKKVALSFDAAWGMVTRATKNEENMRERQLLPLTKSIKSYKIKEKV